MAGWTCPDNESIHWDGTINSHFAGIVSKTPTSDLDLVNKKYVDDNSFSLPSLTLGSVLFSDGSTIIQDNANFFWDNNNNRLGLGTTTPETTLDIEDGDVTIHSTATSDPTIHFLTDSPAHDIEVHLDTSATNDVLTLEGHTAGVDTEFLISALDTRAGVFHLKSGTNEAHFKMDTSGDLEILNENTDKDIVWKYTHAAETHNVTIVAETNKLTHSTGVFDFDDDNIITTGTLGAGATTITTLSATTGTFSDDVSMNNNDIRLGAGGTVIQEFNSNFRVVNLGGKATVQLQNDTIALSLFSIDAGVNNLDILKGAAVDISLFRAATTGENKKFNIVGFPTGGASGALTFQAVNTTTDFEIKTTRSGSNIILSPANNLTIHDSVDLTLSAATGTKIATATTEKLGFWNTTPVAQPTVAADTLANLYTALRSSGIIG